MGFGDGNKYISFGTDFDGAIGNFEGTNGIQIYPPCFAEGGSLATGNVRDVLSGSSAFDTDSRKAIRDALAGGDMSNWELLGGSRVNNGNTWPGMFS